MSLGVFTDRELSVELASLTKPAKTLKRGKHPEFGVIQLPVREVRNIQGQDVGHWPLIYNWAHALVRGNKPGSVRKKMSRCATIVIDTAEFRGQPGQRDTS